MKAGAAFAVLLAAGAPLFLASFPRISFAASRRARRLGLLGCAVAATLVLAMIAIRAGRISGEGLGGMANPLFLELVWTSPLGDAVAWRLAGLALVAGGLVLGARIGPRWGIGMAALGSLLVALSFAMVGHTLGEPRGLMFALLTIHLLAIAWWLAALAPLAVAAGEPDGAALLAAFGRRAVAVVSLLAITGAILSLLLVGEPWALLTTGYGRTLLLKVAFVAGLLAVAAVNKLRFTPALERGDGKARRHLRRAIVVEYVAVALIVVATAVLTSATVPPVNM